MIKQLPIIERAISHGDRVAIHSSSGTTTYKQLIAGSETVAATLLNGSDDLNEARIAYLVPPGERYIQTQWGIWRAGGIAVPLSLSATEKELEYTLTDSQASTLIAAGELAEKVESLCVRRNIRFLTLNDIFDQPQDASPRLSDDGEKNRGTEPDASALRLTNLPEISPVRRAMILYTSGTTSKPKGVVTTHACIQAQIESLIKAWHWQQDDRIPLFLPLHHIHGIINIMSCALWMGAEIEAFPRFRLDTILERVAGRAYSVFMAVPTIYVKLIEAIEAIPCNQPLGASPRFPTGKPSTEPDASVSRLISRESIIQGFAAMRLMVSGSAALPASVHETWTELTGQKLLERYGMTEIGMALSNPYDGERRPGAVGQPLPGVEVRLVGDDGTVIRHQPPGASPRLSDDVRTEPDASASRLMQGEIQVRGPNVFHEYWNRADATNDSFIDGWFKTGDMAVIEDGYYRIMGRSSVDIIKSGGYKLSALEIEASLLDHPAITQCAIVGVPDDTWGEMVAAAIVLKSGEALDLDSLNAWCKDRISPYKIPRRLLIVDELPRNAMGKVTKPAVLKLFIEGNA